MKHLSRLYRLGLIFGLLGGAAACTQPQATPTPPLPPTISPAPTATATAVARVQLAAATAAIVATTTISPTTVVVAASSEAAATPTLTPTRTGTTTAPAPALSPTAALTATTTTAAMALVTAPTLNVRSGPGTAYAIVGQAAAGEAYPILARNAAGDWWQIDLGGLQGWVSGALVRVLGDAQQVATAPEAPTPIGARAPAVRVSMSTITIPTYPYAAFAQPATNPDYNWPYRRFDRAAYEASNPQPTPQTYQMVVLENEYLRITVLPELGGRIYQVIFKPTGHNELYQNPVLKPSPWGPPEQGGWLAAGGIEWGLPVEEHGYAWGDKWGYIILPFSAERAGVTVFMPDEGHLRAEVDIILRAGEAAFTVQPRIVNPTDQAVAYKFWLNAMLAPGLANSVGPELRFLLPTDAVTVHSRGDAGLPAEQQAMSWPIYNGVDYSRLGNWQRWLGVFERPAAHGPYAGVYDTAADEGLMRVYPPAATRGSKAFAMGWADPIPAGNYTDDGSAYAELHGGVAPTFWDQATLSAGGTYTWQETWFPVAGIGGVSYADGSGAVYLAPTATGLETAVFTVRPTAGRVLLTVNGQTVLDEPATVDPAQPWRRIVPTASLPAGGQVRLVLFDAAGTPVLDYAQSLR